MRKAYEIAADKLLLGMPKPKPFGRLVDGRFMRGHMSQHKTRQAVRWRKFWMLKWNT